MRRPPISIIVICVLTVISSYTAIVAMPGAVEQALALAPVYAPLAVLTLVAIGGVWVVTLIGVWMMRKWAVVVSAVVRIIAPIRMTMDADASWERYPLLGPYVTWFWFGVFLACTLPHWNKMSWGKPKPKPDPLVFE